MRRKWISLCFALTCVAAGPLCVSQQNLALASGKVEIVRTNAAGLSDRDNSNVVVWLTPTSGSTRATPASGSTLLQKNKSFTPHMLVVPAGSTVQFPNEDPFFHNVFSLFNGKRFDLGLYEAGSKRTVRFDREGVSYIFCNIHPEMSAVVLALNTNLFGVSDRNGDISIRQVPAGTYEMRVWYEKGIAGSLQAQTRTITIDAHSASLGTLRVIQNENFESEHKNKFGENYQPDHGKSPY